MAIMMVKKAIQREKKVAIPRIKYLLFIAVLALTSCDGTVYHSFKQVDSTAWSPADTLFFVYEGVDRPGDDEALKMAAHVRYNANYKYQHLLMRVETMRVSDTTLLSVDTLYCRVYDDSGRRLGTTVGALYQNSSNEVLVNASPADTLLLRLSHIMADASLEGVCDVGVKLTSHK
jgi:gliding motility-associated lipoprotein GldH